MSSVKTYSDNELADLLRPQNFNWAEEMEEAEEEDENTSSTSASGSGHRESDTDGPLIVDSSSFVPKGPSSETIGSRVASSSQATIHDETSSWLQSDAETQTTGTDEYQVSEELHQSDTADTALARVGREFDWRNHIIYNHDEQEYGPIHHFNWYGQAVREYSGTLAAHSLLYILSRPKIPHPSDKHRVQSILNRAVQFIDSVIYDGDATELQRSGQDLVNAVTGRVYKYYTPHGCWHSDRRDWEEGTIQDNGVMKVYRCPDWVVANGFYDHSLVPTREEMCWNWKNSSLQSVSAWDIQQKRSRQYIPSSLRLVNTADTDTGDDMNEGKVHRVQDKCQWWETAKSVGCSSNEAPSTVSERPPTPEPSFASATKRGELSDCSNAKRHDRCDDNVDSRVAKRRKLCAPYKTLRRETRRLYPVAENSFKPTGADDLESVSRSEQVTDQHDVVSESKNRSEDGLDDSADGDIAVVRPSLADVDLPKKVADVALMTDQTEDLSHTVSHPSASNIPNRENQPNKRNNSLRRPKRSRLPPKRLNGQGGKSKGELRSTNSRSSRAERQITSTEETLTYTSFPEPVFSYERGWKRWLRRKIRRVITRKPLDGGVHSLNVSQPRPFGAHGERASGPPICRAAAAQSGAQEQQPSPSSIEHQQKPRKRSIRKAVTSFILGGLTFMGDYPGQYMYC